MFAMVVKSREVGGSLSLITKIVSLKILVKVSESMLPLSNCKIPMEFMIYISFSISLCILMLSSLTAQISSMAAL